MGTDNTYDQIFMAADAVSCDSAFMSIVLTAPSQLLQPVIITAVHINLFFNSIQNLTAGELQIWLEGPPIQEPSIRLIFSNEGGENIFRTEGSIPGVLVQSAGIEPPYENHGQSLLHGRIVLVKN